jgi:hypothetical protein
VRGGGGVKEDVQPAGVQAVVGKNRVHGLEAAAAGKQMREARKAKAVAEKEKKAARKARAQLHNEAWKELDANPAGKLEACCDSNSVRVSRAYIDLTNKHFLGFMRNFSPEWDCVSSFFL